MLLNQTSILKLNSTVKWLAHIIYNKEDQGQISIQTSYIVIKLSCVPLQLLEANAMLIPTIWPLPLPSVSLPNLIIH